MSGWSSIARYIIGSPKICVIRSDSIVASSRTFTAASGEDAERVPYR